MKREKYAKEIVSVLKMTTLKYLYLQKTFQENEKNAIKY